MVHSRRRMCCCKWWLHWCCGKGHSICGYVMAGRRASGPLPESLAPRRASVDVSRRSVEVKVADRPMESPRLPPVSPRNPRGAGAFASAQVRLQILLREQGTNR